MPPRLLMAAPDLRMLAEAGAVCFCVGGWDGSRNFGDLAQVRHVPGTVGGAGALPVLVVEAALRAQVEAERDGLERAAGPFAVAYLDRADSPGAARPGGPGPAPAEAGPAGAGPGPAPAGPGPAGTGPADPDPADPAPAEAGPGPAPAGPAPAGTGPAGTGPADPEPADPGTGSGLAEPPPLAPAGPRALYLYGGGYATPGWGDRKADMADAVQAWHARTPGAAPLAVVATGVQVDPGYAAGAGRLVDWLARAGVLLVRDRASLAALAGAAPHAELGADEALLALLAGPEGPGTPVGPDGPAVLGAPVGPGAPAGADGCEDGGTRGGPPADGAWRLGVHASGMAYACEDWPARRAFVRDLVVGLVAALPAAGVHAPRAPSPAAAMPAAAVAPVAGAPATGAPPAGISAPAAGAPLTGAPVGPGVGAPVAVVPVAAFEDSQVRESAYAAELAGELAAAGLDVADAVDVSAAGLDWPGRWPFAPRLVVASSYHVALASLVQGVPVVLVAGNAYYAQKAAGLRDQLPGAARDLLLVVDPAAGRPAVDPAWLRRALDPARAQDAADGRPMLRAAAARTREAVRAALLRAAADAAAAALDALSGVAVRDATDLGEVRRLHGEAVERVRLQAELVDAARADTALIADRLADVGAAVEETRRASLESRQEVGAALAALGEQGTALAALPATVRAEAERAAAAAEEAAAAAEEAAGARAQRHDDRPPDTVGAALDRAARASRRVAGGLRRRAAAARAARAGRTGPRPAPAPATEPAPGPPPAGVPAPAPGPAPAPAPAAEPAPAPAAAPGGAAGAAPGPPPGPVSAPAAPPGPVRVLRRTGIPRHPDDAWPRPVVATGPVLVARATWRDDGLDVRVGTGGDGPAGPERRLWYRWGGDALPGPPDRLDAVAVALLPYAMAAARPLHVDGPVHRGLLAALEEYQDAWHAWAPWRFARVQLSAAGVVDGAPPPDAGDATAAHSGGVDSAYQLLAHAGGLLGHRSRTVRRAVFVHGLDVAADDEAGGRLAVEGARRLPESLGVPLAVLRTNWREFAVHYEQTHMAGVAAALHLCGRGTSAGLVAAEYPYEADEPGWGSNAATNPLLGSPAFPVLTTGLAEDRLARTRLVASSRAALEGLRVCWAGPEPGRNCGTCMKCLLTALCLAAVGVPDPPTLPAATPQAVRAVRLRAPASLREWEQVEAHADALPADLAAAVRDLLARTREEFAG